MNNSVVTAAVEAASQEGYSTLRFNFRGVGDSEGSCGEGIGEREDVAAAIDYFSSRQTDPDPYLVLLGYSFGAWAGLPAASEDGRVKEMVAIAPPLELYDFKFLESSKKRKLIVVGSRDLFCPPPALERWYQRLEEPKALTVLQGADHFFFSHHRALAQTLREFLKKR